MYDEYHLELNMHDGLSEDILGNYAGYLAQAKLHEAEGKTIPSCSKAGSRPETDKAALTEKVTSLEGQAGSPIRRDGAMRCLRTDRRRVHLQQEASNRWQSNYMVKVSRRPDPQNGKDEPREVPDQLASSSSGKSSKIARMELRAYESLLAPSLCILMGKEV
ncbi:MAG: hypothetical protein ACLU9S_17805 [Oscillospiraceae bacterium]